MKCCRCPLYHYWSNESDRGEECAIFGDGWDSPFQYEDKEGTTIGCYLDRHFIEKADAERDEYYASMAESMAQDLWNTDDTPQTERRRVMSDLIERQAAIDALAVAIDDVGILDGDDIKIVFDNLPSAQPEPQWIPVTERLPDDNREVLISLEWGIDIGMYERGEWRSEWINHYDDDNVLAWMPLPESYKGE